MNEGVFSRRYRGFSALIVLLIGLDALDGILVGTAMPAVLADLGGIGWFGWTVGAFGLATFVAIPIFGGLASRWGLRPALLVSVALFVAGSAAAALAPTMKLLVGARVLQGLGMGGITVLPFAIISGHFPKEARARPLALISPVGVITGLLGPVIAALIINHAAWPWVFWLNVPLGLLVIGLTLWVLPRDEPLERPRSRMNLAGPVLIGVTAGFALKAFTSEWPVNLAQWGVALVALALFVLHERKHPNPFIPADAWKLTRPLGAVFLAVIFIRAAYGAAKIYLPLLLEGVWGLSALATGFILTLGSLTWNGGSFYVSTARGLRAHLAEKGTLLFIGALLLILAILWKQGAVEMMFVFWAIAGIGMGVTTTYYSSLAMQVAEDYPAGVAGATLQLGRTFGGAVGAAAANSVAQLGFGGGFDPKQLKGGALSGASLHSLVWGASFAKGLGVACALLSVLVAWKFSQHVRRRNAESMPGPFRPDHALSKPRRAAFGLGPPATGRRPDRPGAPRSRCAPPAD